MNPRQDLLLFAPRSLDPRSIANLAAWYDLSDPLSYILGTGVKLLGDKSGNSAVNVLVCPGIASNNATIPDNANLRCSNSQTLDLVVRVLINDSTLVSQQTLISKRASSGDDQYTFIGFKGATNFVLRLIYGTSGGSFNTIGCPNEIVVSSLTKYWFWVHITAETNPTASFYYAPDQPTEPTSWTHAGDTTFPAGGVYGGTGTGTLTFGTRANGTSEPLAGLVYFGRVAIAGATVAQVDFAKAAKLAATFVCDTGQTVTINTSGDLGARICGARDLVQLTGAKQPTLSGGGMRFTAAGSQYMASAPFALPQPWCDYPVLQQVAWSSGKYLLDGLTQNTGGLVMTTSTPQLDLNAGSAVAANTDLAVGVKGLVRRLFNGASSSLGVNRKAVTTGNAGAGVPNGLIVCASGATIGNYSDGILYEWPVLASALPAQDAQIANYLIRKWGIQA